MENTPETKVNLQEILSEGFQFTSECDDFGVGGIREDIKESYKDFIGYDEMPFIAAVLHENLRAINTAQYQTGTSIAYELSQVKLVLADIAESLRVISNR